MSLIAHKKQTLKSTQHGATLIEILVSLLVLSIGLIGMASVQLTSIRSTQASFFRSEATLLAYDIADRMRVNSTVAANYSNYDTDNPVVQMPGCAVAANGCTVAQQVTVDLVEWTRSIEGTGGNSVLLPAAQGTISSVGSLFTVTIFWRETAWDLGVVAAADGSVSKTEGNKNIQVSFNI